MATQESDYFPPLDRCLASYSPTIIPWTQAYRLLIDLPTALRSQALEQFFSTPEALQCLISPLTPFPRPTPATKGQFETRTAPIHVSQVQKGDGGWDLDQLKGDALWLSQRVQIDEEAALRIAIDEAQGRDAERVTLARETSPQALIHDNGGGVDLDQEDMRRGRVLATYLDERQSILSISTELATRHAVAKGEATKADEWLVELAKKVAAGQQQQGQQAFIKDALDAVRDCTTMLDDSTKRQAVFSQDDRKSDLFATATLLRITDLLRLILTHLHSLEALPGSEIVLAWFNLMAECAFMQGLQGTTAMPNVEPLQCLAALVSLTMVKLPLTVTKVTVLAEAAPNVQYPKLPGATPYVDDMDTVRTLNRILYRAAHDGLVVAAPAVYAWSLVAKLFRDGAERERYNRELIERQRIEETGEIGPEMPDAMVEERWGWFLSSDVEEAREDPARYWAMVAVDDMNVYSIMASLRNVITVSYGGELDYGTALIARSGLYDLIAQSLDVVDYDAPLLDALLAVLTPDSPPNDTNYFASLATKFMTSADDRLKPAILDQALARYPYELSPLMRLCTVLAAADGPYAAGRPLLVELLDHLETITVQVPEHFTSYRLENEDEGTNRMVLTEDLTLFAPRAQQSFYGERQLRFNREVDAAEHEGPRNVLLIPAGSQGIVIREERPMVLSLRHEHSGLEYLGLALASLTPGAELVPSHQGAADFDLGTAAEIISLINSLLSSAMKIQNGAEEAAHVLGRLSYALQEEKDIITIISQIFELQLQAHMSLRPAVGSSEVCVACAEFFAMLVDSSPERVWSVLTRSSLLGLGNSGVGGVPAIGAVIEAQAAAGGGASFLAACAKLYHAVFDDAVAGLVKRRASADLKSARSGSRFDSASPVGSLGGTPERTIRVVMEGFTRCMVEILQNLESLRIGADAKAVVLREVLRTWDEVLRFTHGLVEVVASQQQQQQEGRGAVVMVRNERLCAPLFAAAEVVLKAFTTTGAEVRSPVLETLVSCLEDGLALGNVDIASSQQEALISQTSCTANFLATVLRTQRCLEPRRAWMLANQLAKHISTLAAAFVTDSRWKAEMATLFEEIVISLACTDADPTALLGGLNQYTAKAFLSVVKQFDGPIKDLHAECQIWNFLTAALEGRQQWIGIFLLTGSMPRTSRFERSTATSSTTKAASKSTLLHSALDRLSEISQVIPTLAKAMLHFIATAQNLWPWATVTVRSHPDFMTKTLKWLDEIVPPTPAASSRPGAGNNEEVSASEYQAATYLCDILAVGLHAGLETGDRSVLKALVPRLGFLTRSGVGVDAYNRSLHRNLAENLGRKFGGVQLAAFARSGANKGQHGRGYFYDLELADRVLGYSALAWEGNEDVRAQGFAPEVVRANMNLSLVDAQRNLLGSWKVLATTLSEFVGFEDAVQEPLIKSVMAAVAANAKTRLDEPGCAEVLQMRADMGFVVLSKLVGIKCEKEGMKSLLTGEVVKKSEREVLREPGVWDLVRQSPVDYEVATAQEDLRYYRTLLRILFLAIRPHGLLPLPKLDGGRLVSLSAEVASVMVEIVGKTIAPGFRALCGNLHGDISMALPADFALITALLQAVLSVNGVGIAHAQLAEAVANSSLVRSALSLYSWADQLGELTMEQDPIYGETAMNTLVQLSTIPPIAEQMAMQGILLSISSTNLSNYFRKPAGKGPWDEPGRMFTIWSEGILPLCLNLLEAVGAPLAAEVSVFLNGFAEQLLRAERAFRTSGGRRQHPHSGDVTLGLVKEAYALVHIGLTLKADLARAAAEGLSAAEIPVLNYDLESVRQEVAGLARTQRSLADKIVPSNAREEGMGAEALQGPVLAEIHAVMRCFGDGVE
ncbi:hypothetical protein LTR78_006684 [Recurvomyces mirabilis]|uniref:Nucleoporin n=1 Tax=Recurvomyces mirabilis TaxID=574656 RepID=A0AAE0WKN0_9PEZI|nr:hypothetical protein LTR78_006684 [Recurvomyces mirabilis]KAK5151427.1 hypothetical protein LTS14_009270 [Recurvomyces mirabilis]